MGSLTFRQAINRVVACLVILSPAWASAAETTLGFGSAGKVHIGARFDQLGIPLKEPIDRKAQDFSGRCFYVAAAAAPRFLIMLVDERVVRFDVYEPGLATAEGIRVGDSVEKLRSAYGAQLASAPNFYSEDDLDYRIKSPDGRYAYRFESHAGKVTSIFAGDAKAVEYVEGCL